MHLRYLLAAAKRDAKATLGVVMVKKTLMIKSGLQSQEACKF
jgi:hypothetical protein